MKDFVQVRIESPAFESGAVHVAELTGKEQISRLFEFELRLATLDGNLDEDALLTSPLTLVFERRVGDSSATLEIRRISGMVRAIRDRALGESKHREYIVTLVPRVWRATLTSTSDVCMDLTVPAIIQKKLGEVGLNPAKDVLFRMKHEHAPREFVVQYRESHWDFACRLAEDLGIHFSFEEIDGEDVIVFGDENAAFTPSSPAKCGFSARGDLTEVYELEAHRELVSKSFVARDYNYRNPSMEVLGEAKTSVLGQGKVDEYGPHAKTPEEATYYAMVRSEEAATRSFTYEGRSDLPGLRAGSQVTIEGHPRGDIDMIVTEVFHELTQPVFGLAPANARPYRNTFRGLPKAVPYRPARLTPKPLVHGVVTGIVESESATKLGAIDAEGRYRVALMYDSVTDRGDGKASRPLRMAQSSAGSSRGFHAPLTVGTEVIITCVNGDPDRPIIAGAVANPQTPSPVTSANAEKSMWKTNVNSIAIDDDKPRCKISVADGAHVVQVGQPNAPEEGIVFLSTENVTNVAKKLQTASSEMANSYTADKMGTASKDIVAAAGVPNPISTWEKIEHIAEKTAEFAKAVMDMADAVDDMFDEALKEAQEHKKAADEKLKETKKKAFEKLAKGAKPQPIEGKDGGARYETKDEAEARAYAEALKDPKNKPTADAIAEATKDSAEASKEVEEHKGAKGSKEARAEIDEKLKEFKEIGDTAKEVAEDGEKAGDDGKEAGKYFKERLSGKKKLTDLHGLGAAIKSLGGKKLISKVSEIFAKAAQKALDATVSGSQKVSHAVPKASGQRFGDDVGEFKTPWNIQLSRHSAALYGAKNAFVFGGMNATVSSMNATSILARKRVDVKSRSLVEVASKKVALSAIKEIDAYSDGTMLLVAGSKGVKVPGEASIMVSGQKDVHLVSDDESLHVKANKNVSVLASEGNMILTVKKKDLLIAAQEGKYELKAKGDILLDSTDGKLTLLAKTDGRLTTQGKFDLLAKDDATLTCNTELNIKSKSGAWKASGDLELKTKKLTVNAGKIELG